jgi:dTDP-glucose 4,6-dehydratase
MKRVLLTGGGGAIGAHFIAHFMQNTDWEVVVLDSFRHKGYRDRIKSVCKTNPEWWSRISIIHTDLVCPISKALRLQIGNVNYILHLAAMSDVFFSVENPAYVIKNNIDSTLMLLEYAKETPHDVFLYFSTDEVYGPVEKGKAHKEWATHRPSNAYSASKAASEDICYAYWRKGDANLVITNTMNNFGEMQAPSKFPAMIQTKLEKGEPIIIHGNEKEIGSRFYLHSRNAADAILYILNNLTPAKHKTGEIDEPDRYHVVGEVCLTNLELAQRIGRLMGKELKYELEDFHKDNPAHDIHYGLEDNKLRSSGWKQPLDFDESMKNTIDWQQKNKEWLE